MPDFKLSKPSPEFLSQVAKMTARGGSPGPAIKKATSAIQEAQQGEVEEMTFTPWIDAGSSNLDTIRYSEEGKALDVRFKNGSVYRYASVPPFVWESLLLSPSRGRFLHHSIKPRFLAKRLPGV